MALVFLVLGGVGAAVTYRDNIFRQGTAVATTISAEVRSATPLPAALMGTTPIASAKVAPSETAQTLLPAASLSAGSRTPAEASKTATAAKKKAVSAKAAKADGSEKSSGGYFTMPTTGKNWGVLHGKNGVDIANSCGTNVRAAAEGTVTSVGRGWNGGYGNDVVIKHPNGMKTHYAHLQTIGVSEGDSVAQGESVGTMGSTGKSTGCHLHFEVQGGRNPFANR